VDAQVWATLDERLYNVPVFTPAQFAAATEHHAVMNVVRVDAADISAVGAFAEDPTLVIWLMAGGLGFASQVHRAFDALDEMECHAPVFIDRATPDAEEGSIEQHVLYTASDVGAVLVDGRGNGLIARGEGGMRLPYGLLQATRMRMTKTEYISCPSCGRTLFDLQVTTAAIREKTDHLKGVKIGIMGCIVNGPGEMADADYGYVGSGPDKITLYRGQEIVQRAIPTSEALEALIGLMRDDGKWIEPENRERRA
jgi:(E)-4-hydroxy-3-methylbut-2-enyl-diphosphate synthase